MAKTRSYTDWASLRPLLTRDAREASESSLQAMHEWFRAHPTSPALACADVAQWLRDNAERINEFYKREG